MRITKGNAKMADSVLKTKPSSFEDMFSTPTSKTEEPISEEDDEPSMYAAGGEVKKDYVKKEDKGFGSIIMPSEIKDDMDQEDHHSSVAAAIMARSKPKKLAEGGMIATLGKEDYNEDDFKHLDDPSSSSGSEEEPEDMGHSSIAVKIRNKQKAQ
jgi:hypothetical protein